MRISVIGCGYLGAVHAACMTVLGHEVVGIDVDERKVEALRAGRAPFFEPGLPELLEQAVATGRLTFSTAMSDAAGADVHPGSVEDLESLRTGAASGSSAWPASTMPMRPPMLVPTTSSRSIGCVACSCAISATMSAAYCGTW